MWIWALLVILFWAVVPGLITGWMFRERGRRFLPGLILGFFCGPLGIIVALAFIYVSDRRRARRRRGHGHAVRVFYDIPVVGRLHVSTVWGLAGLATFLCLWMVGGVTYEFYRNGLQPAAQGELRNAAAEAPKTQNLVEGPTPAGRLSSEPAPNARAQGGHSGQGHAALLGNVSAQAEPSGQTPAGEERTAPVLTQLSPGEVGPTLIPPQTRGADGGQLTPPTVQGVPGAPPLAKAPVRPRAEAVAEVTRDLASKGHRVHAALSGDAQTATLSLSGATLTRGSGNQLLAGRVRQALKAAGVRIVVVVNGAETWTYIL